MTTATLDKPTTTQPRRIRASIDARALKRVTNFFNGTALDIMTELLQNARRAGATRIDVETTRQGFTVIDDGRGIADPAVLLRFGGSEWDGGTIVREDAAGMGVYSLAGLRSRITSRAGNGETGWTVELGPEDYQGERTVEVTSPDPDDLAKLNGPRGTVITVKWAGAAGSAVDYGHHDYRLWGRLRDDPDGGREAATDSATETAARYLPLPVRLNGRHVEQHDYLDGVVRVHGWAGLRIGVSRTAQKGEFKRNAHATGINVCGHVVGMSLPQLEGLEHVYKTRVEVVDCPDLKIVLPARKEVVQNDFIERLKDECERALLQQMSSDGAKASFATFQAGRKLGLNMVEAPIRLAKWRPQSSDGTTWNVPYESVERIDAEALGESAVIVERPNSIGQADGQILAWIEENAKPTHRWVAGKRMRLLAHDGSLVGYPAYERLWHLVRMKVMCHPETGADEVSAALHPDRMSHTAHQAHELEHPDGPPQVLPRAKSITVKLEIERRPQPTGAAETRTLEYPAPFAFAGETAYAGGILLTEDAERQIDTDGLAEILFNAYYKENPSNLDDEMDENDAASYMRNLAMTVLGDDDDRRREMIGDGTLDAARSYAPRDRGTLIRMRWNPERGDFDIKVDFENPSETGLTPTRTTP